MIDWNDAFDNSGYVEGAGRLADVWAKQAADFRHRMDDEGRAERDLAYGEGARQVFDFFRPEGPPRGCLIFVHGGYWHLFDKSWWSNMSQGALAHGWSVAIPSYPLAPDARVHEITGAIAQAVTRVASKQSGPIALAGHSAGGHLVARMADPAVLTPDVQARIHRITSISGVHHLEPLLHTRMNETLMLDQAEARAESTVFQEFNSDIPISFWVGAGERPEFLRQNRMGAEYAAAQRVDVSETYDTGENHFSVIDALADPQSALMKEILR
ncbi:alpha/beta hydrolase [Sulfitobacter sp. S190]|uniref:alpha/beta hydrolase n=1 Tax=Sulfitobacter sp. S190 TaxID=2867022 RepID=UPI0021A465A9|nr:alpha/beta hydrolase [Sulfitobacter sp. S190]UWR24347.1 alpha/beta hydrolase [Sulfitobacter sp. S190]